MTETGIQIRRMTPDDIPMLAEWMVLIPLWNRYGLTIQRAVEGFEGAFRTGDILQVADQGLSRADATAAMAAALVALLAPPAPDTGSGR